MTNPDPIATNEFLLRDYELKADFLKAHFERMWKRFDVFLVIESALFAFFFKFLPTNEGEALRPHAWIFAVLGLVSTLIGILFGAQDRYLVTTYRRSLWYAGCALRDWQDDAFEPAEWRENYRPVGTVVGVPDREVGNQTKWVDRRGILEWHTKYASTTTLPTLFALAASVLWIVTLVVFS